jgi:hypothetical protein
MKIHKDLGHGGIALQDLGDLMRAIHADLQTLKAAVDQLQDLTPGANASTDLTLEQ